MSIATDDLTGTPEPDSDEYDEMIQNLDSIIELGLHKLTGDGRISSNEQKERCRAEYMKRVEQAIRAKREVVKDRRLQEMGRTLEALQESDEFDL
jgi:hypothetical protein